MAINLITGYNIYSAEKSGSGVIGSTRSVYPYKHENNNTILNQISKVQNCNILNDNFNLI